MESSYSAPDQGGAPPRASDDDRERVAIALGEAFARGSLDATEHEQRVSSTWQACYVEELATLTNDLPGPGRVEVARAQRESELREWLREWRWWLGGAVIMSAIWGVQAIRSGPDFYWPLVPLGIWAAVLVAVAIWPSQDEK